MQEALAAAAIALEVAAGLAAGAADAVTVSYNLGCAAALAGDRHEAERWLGAAVAVAAGDGGGLSLLVGWELAGDPDLAGLWAAEGGFRSCDSQLAKWLTMATITISHHGHPHRAVILALTTDR